jgi:hypothetical protein
VAAFFDLEHQGVNAPADRNVGDFGRRADVDKDQENRFQVGGNCQADLFHNKRARG